MSIKFKKQSSSEGEIHKIAFNSKPKIILNAEEFGYEDSVSEILNFVDVWISEGSGWTIEKIVNHYINFVKYQPLRGSSYVPRPKELRNSMKGLINLTNKNDDECFRLCHVRHLNPQKKHNEIIKKCDREFAKKLDYTGVTFPVQVIDIPRIERQNKIGVNLFSYDNEFSSLFIF